MQKPLVSALILAALLLTTSTADDELTTTIEPILETTVSAVSSSEAASASPSPTPIPVRQHAFLDGNTLLPLLIASGGPPGEFPVESEPKEPSTGDCTSWLYEYTNSFPDGGFRHEHAIRHNSPLREATGVYAKTQTDGKSSFVIEYTQTDGAPNITATSKCNTTEWNVIICQQSNDLYKDFVVHGHQNAPCRDTPIVPAPTVLENKTTLEELVGIDILKKEDLSVNFDLEPLLAYFGGAPGEVVSAWNRNFTLPEPPLDPLRRPLPDTKRASWLYDFRAINSPYSLRFEHATLRFKGQPDEFVDVRGTIYWRTSNGDFRIEYHQDDTGLKSNVNIAKCTPIRGYWACEYSPKSIPHRQ